MADTDSTLTRLQIAACATLVLGSALVLGHAVFVSPAVSFLSGGVDAEWIGYPIPASTDAIPFERERLPRFRFVKRFRVERAPQTARLELRALRNATLYLDGRALPQKVTQEGWKRVTHVPLDGGLSAGHHELQVEVVNPEGPALLQLALRADGLELKTDSSWKVETEGLPAAFAERARDSRRLAESMLLPTPDTLFVRHFGALAALFAAGALLHALATRGRGASALKRAPEITLGLATLYWLAVFVFKVARLPVMMGFDIPGHLEYIDFLIAEGRLPLATDGWSTYHPPLFYLLTAFAVAITGVAQESGAGQLVYRLVGYAAGLAIVWATYFCARLLFRGDALRTSLAVAFAALLPMNLYISAYVSNESLQAAMVGLALLLTLRALLRERARSLELAAVGCALGLAILCKVTSIVTIPFFAIALGLKVWLLEGPDDARRAPGRAGAAAANVLAAAGLVGGWFYVRNWIHYGRPILINTDLPQAITWWEQPGFHTWAYYTKFGEALRHPFFAGFHSFWDGIYSTFWGDGLAAGMVQLATRHPMWSYDFMTLAYWLAAPTLVLLPLGYLRTLANARRDDDPRRRIAFSLVAALVFVLSMALLLISLTTPYYAQAKAFYVLTAVTPLSLVAAEGLAEIPTRAAEGRFQALRMLYFGWLAAAAGVLALSFMG